MHWETEREQEPPLPGQLPALLLPPSCQLPPALASPNVFSIIYAQSFLFFFCVFIYTYIFIFILLVLRCLFYGNFSWDFPIFMQLILCLLYIPRCTMYTNTAPAISGNFLCMCACLAPLTMPLSHPPSTRALSLRCVLILICILSYSLCYVECVESVEWRGKGNRRRGRACCEVCHNSICALLFGL